MNISDLPQDLFEYHIFDDPYPHCNLINNYIKFVDIYIKFPYMYDMYGCPDTVSEIAHLGHTVRQIIIYNNKSLLLLYTHCSYLHLDSILFYSLCQICIEFNYFNTLKWATLNKFNFAIDDIFYRIYIQKNIFPLHSDNICYYALTYNRLRILKWLLKNYDHQVNYCFNYISPDDPYCVFIINARIPVIRWLVANDFKIRINIPDTNKKINKKKLKLLQHFRHLFLPAIQLRFYPIPMIPR